MISLFFNFNGYQNSSIIENENERLKFERDSIIGYDMEQSIMREISHKDKIDSLVNYNKVYIKADSINKLIIRNEKAKLRLLTRAGRDKVRDSIFTANNIPLRTR